MLNNFIAFLRHYILEKKKILDEFSSFCFKPEQTNLCISDGMYYEYF